MIILITGVPGTGKTLYCVDMLLKMQKSEPHRPIYANIDGLQVPGVLPAPEDWREVPDGSIVVYDECQQKFGPDGAGRSGREDIQQMEVHRHRGIDIILITQHPKLLHAHIRRLIGRHHHLFRMHGTHSAKVWTREGQIDVDKMSQLREQDCTLWVYPKECFGLYKSATLHTHKRRVPAFVRRAGVGLVVVIALVAFAFYNARGFFQGDLGTAQAAASGASAPVLSPYTDDEPIPVFEQPPMVKGCVASATACRCYGADSLPLDISEGKCRSMLEGPLMFPASMRSLPSRT